MWWMKVFSHNKYQTIVDFGNGMKDNILVQFRKITSKLKLFVFDETKHISILTDAEISIGEWSHVAVTYKNNQFKLFINSSLNHQQELEIPLTILNKERQSNFIGGDNWNNPAIDAILDELKIFERALSKEEIKNEKQFKQPYNMIYI